MPAPSPSWNLVRVYGTWRNLNGTPKKGTYKVSIPVKITNATDDSAIPAGTFLSGVLSQDAGSPSLDVMVPATDDPDVQQVGWQVSIEVSFADKSKTERYRIDIPYADRPTADGGTGNGVNLRGFTKPEQVPVKDVMLKVGVAGGIALLDGTGAALNADGTSASRIAVDAATTATGAATAAGTSAQTAQTAATTAQNAATAASATTDSQMASRVNDSASATRAALDGRYAGRPGANKNSLTGWFHADGFGAVGDGTADDTTALQAAINAADTAGGGRVYLKKGTYKVTSGLLLPSKVFLAGDSAGGQVGNATKITYAGPSGGTLLSPKVRTSDTINWKLEGIDFNGGGLAAIVVEFYRVSYSRMQDCAVYGALAGTGVGVLFDANVSNQCYFNVVDNVKVDGAPVGVRFQLGANANRWVGGKIGNGGTGMEFLSASSGNIVIATDLEQNTVRHVYLDAGANVFLGLHMEVAPIGYSITANGSGTRRFGTTFAATVTSYVTDASTLSGAIDETTTDTYQLKVGATNVLSKMLSGATTLSVDPAPFSGTASVQINVLRNVTTTGTRQFNVYRGNGSADTGFAVDLNTRVITLGNTATSSAGGGQGVVPISNAVVVPSTNPAGGGVLYVEAGALKFKGSSGTVTVIAPA